MKKLLSLLLVGLASFSLQAGFKPSLKKNKVSFPELSIICGVGNSINFKNINCHPTPDLDRHPTPDLGDYGFCPVSPVKKGYCPVSPVKSFVECRTPTPSPVRTPTIQD